jgi:transcriptional regulator with XRE-family HTH domain
MKTRTAISSIVGLTQKEIAVLLRITRSQWSLFELGLGNLPLHANTLLAEMITYAGRAEKAAKKQSIKERQKHTDQKLTQMQQENAFQLLRNNRRLAIAEKKHAAQSRMLLLANFFENDTDKKSAVAKQHSNLLADKTSKEKETAALETLIELRIKQKVLEFEKTLLQEKISL